MNAPQFTGMKVFSTTLARDREVMGDNITRWRGPILPDLLKRELFECRVKPVPAAEVAQHGLDVDARPSGDILKRGLDGNLLPCKIEASLQNSPAGLGRAFRPPGVVVRPLHIHVSHSRHQFNIGVNSYRHDSVEAASRSAD